MYENRLINSVVYLPRQPRWRISFSATQNETVLLRNIHSTPKRRLGGTPLGTEVTTLSITATCTSLCSNSEDRTTDPGSPQLTGWDTFRYCYYQPWKVSPFFSIRPIQRQILDQR